MKQLAFLIVFSGVLAWWLNTVEEEKPPSKSSTAISIGKIKTSASGSQNRKPSSKVEVHQQSWKAIAKWYGSSLKPKFSRQGKLIRIDGAPGNGKKVPNYQAKNPQHAIRRARQVVRDLSALVGIQNEKNLQKPMVQNSEFSSKVHFSQYVQGIPLTPDGQIIVNLGPNGELVGFQSTYRREVELTNEYKIHKKTAKNRLAHSENPILGGSQVAWVSRKDSTPEKTVARRGYEFADGTDYVIIDGETGEELIRRDGRTY